MREPESKVLFCARPNACIKDRTSYGSVEFVERVQESLLSALGSSADLRAAGPEEGTRLDVILPRLLQEESDPFVVLELVQQDQLDACVDTLSGGEKPNSEAKRKAHLRA